MRISCFSRLRAASRQAENSCGQPVKINLPPRFRGSFPVPNQVEVEANIRQILAALSPDLLSLGWREKNKQSGNPLVGHCYVAAEALFHLLGGKEAGWTPYILTHQSWPEELDRGETHWFLKHRSGLIADPTAGQIEGGAIPYKRAMGKGFLTKAPSRRARTVLFRIQGHAC